MSRQEPARERELKGYAYEGSDDALFLRMFSGLEAYCDPITGNFIDELPLPGGAACLELGAGGGSMVRRLAARVGPTGQVVAVDRDPRFVTPAPNVRIVRHDLQLGLPESCRGPYSLIHARLTLSHLPNRRQLLGELVDALAPGGWLVVGEFSQRPLRVLNSPSEDDSALFGRLMHRFTEIVMDHADIEDDWAHKVYAAMYASGLERLRMTDHAENWTGGSPGAELNWVAVNLVRDRMIAAGVTEDEMRRFRQFTADLRAASLSWEFVCVRGRKPAGLENS
ncbi:methyltransferase domain-containing protein [Streptomyces sp. NBC_01077]|uniref:class I SAM-dependent methyltransferase n=1 Tax=Streptomyces sp. NBC_01077 TaxID=2903746 RepID=UPI0038683DD9|nr:methyltransferase domain-containing protein [Streptomyces sp. NBC_01077]WSV43575.1 methyltransferase domain-containing protein [Streptomyces sp. NBC_01077]